MLDCYQNIIIFGQHFKNPMKKNYLQVLLLVFTLSISSSCSDNDDEENYTPVSPVVVDLTQVPYPKLSDYHFIS